MKYLLHQLYILHSGTLIAKLKALVILSATVSVTFSPITYLLNKFDIWYVSNIDYLLWVLGAILFDWVIGTRYHIKIKKDANLKDNLGKLFLKLTMVMSAMYLFEGLAYFLKDIPYIVGISTNMLRLIVFMWPAWSAIANMHELTGKRFPPLSFMNKIDNLTNIKRS